MNECGNKWILFAEGLCYVWEWNDCVRDQRPELSHSMTDGQCWWFLSIQDPESPGDRQHELWGGLRLIVFTTQSSYQYTDTHHVFWDQLWIGFEMNPHQNCSCSFAVFSTAEVYFWLSFPVYISPVQCCGKPLRSETIGNLFVFFSELSERHRSSQTGISEET